MKVLTDLGGQEILEKVGQILQNNTGKILVFFSSTFTSSTSYELECAQTANILSMEPTPDTPSELPPDEVADGAEHDDPSHLEEIDGVPPPATLNLTTVLPSLSAFNLLMLYPTPFFPLALILQEWKKSARSVCSAFIYLRM